MSEIKANRVVATGQSVAKHCREKMERGCCWKALQQKVATALSARREDATALESHGYKKSFELFIG